MNPKKRWKLYRTLAKLRLYGALAFIAPQKVYQFLRGQNP
jgi:hypothetical protein